MLRFDNTYARLPDRFFARVSPTPVSSPRIVRLNRELARTLGGDPERLSSPEGATVLAGNVVPDGAEPIALAYAGHQFGGFVSQLGDGRAILLGEARDERGRRRDVQLKGAGKTPFSRGGDGRAAIGPVLREYVVSEAMAALGVPTTRALAAVTTGERVFREEALPGAVLARVAESHIRVGTFEYFAARGDREALSILTSYALERHRPEEASSESPALALLDHVIERQARLVAHWLSIGFIHGVMNTDNTTISGETIDYGPCAFLDEYHPSKCFSSIDRGGRYAFARQPAIAQWNIARLAETLLPLVDVDEDTAVERALERIGRFPAAFEAEYARRMRAKLGLVREDEADRALISDLFAQLASNEVDFTLFFRRLCASAASSEADGEVAALFAEPMAFHDWAISWRRRLATETAPPDVRAASMRLANPAFVPRNHRIEQAIGAAVAGDDFGPFERLADVLARPFDDQPEHADLAGAPASHERVRATFCGT